VWQANFHFYMAFYIQKKEVSLPHPVLFLIKVQTDKIIMALRVSKW
jgi:hypothetical protein